MLSVHEVFYSSFEQVQILDGLLQQLVSQVSLIVCDVSHIPDNSFPNLSIDVLDVASDQLLQLLHRLYLINMIRCRSRQILNCGSRVYSKRASDQFDGLA